MLVHGSYLNQTLVSIDTFVSSMPALVRTPGGSGRPQDVTWLSSVELQQARMMLRQESELVANTDWDKIDEVADTIDDLKTTVDELNEERPANVQAHSIQKLKGVLKDATVAADELENQNENQKE
jgi:hypothetical protein